MTVEKLVKQLFLAYMLSNFGVTETNESSNLVTFIVLYFQLFAFLSELIDLFITLLYLLLYRNDITIKTFFSKIIFICLSKLISLANYPSKLSNSVKKNQYYTNVFGDYRNRYCRVTLNEICPILFRHPTGVCASSR